jgi:hypothetical protein
VEHLKIHDEFRINGRKLDNAMVMCGVKQKNLVEICLK